MDRNPESVLLRGRAAAEALMTAVFDTFEPDGTHVVGGFNVTRYVLVGQTCGKIQAGSTSAEDPASQRVSVGSVERPELSLSLHIPIASALPTAGDRGVGWEYQCTAVSCAQDPNLVGTRYLVVSVPTKSFATARRLDVVEVPVPEGS